MARAWYSYEGTGSKFLPDNYIFTPLPPTCINGRILCSIYAPIGENLKPANISPNIVTYIGAGISSGIAQPIAPNGAKRYVYFLPVAG